MKILIALSLTWLACLAYYFGYDAGYRDAPMVHISGKDADIKENHFTLKNTRGKFKYVFGIKGENNLIANNIIDCPAEIEE